MLAIGDLYQSRRRSPRRSAGLSPRRSAERILRSKYGPGDRVVGVGRPHQHRSAEQTPGQAYDPSTKTGVLHGRRGGVGRASTTASRAGPIVPRVSPVPEGTPPRAPPSTYAVRTPPERSDSRHRGQHGRRVLGTAAHEGSMRGSSLVSTVRSARFDSTGSRNISPAGTALQGRASTAVSGAGSTALPARVMGNAARRRTRKQAGQRQCPTTSRRRRRARATVSVEYAAEAGRFATPPSKCPGTEPRGSTRSPPRRLAGSRAGADVPPPPRARVPPPDAAAAGDVPTRPRVVPLLDGSPSGSTRRTRWGGGERAGTGAIAAGAGNDTGSPTPLAADVSTCCRRPLRTGQPVGHPTRATVTCAPTAPGWLQGPPRDPQPGGGMFERTARYMGQADGWSRRAGSRPAAADHIVE